MIDRLRRWFRVAGGSAVREMRDVLAQPRLIGILVLGPFLILGLFGAGYRNETISLRTVFVVPEGSEIEQTVEANAERIEDYVVPTMFTTDLILARQQLIDDHADLVVVFPDGAEEQIRSGERAEIAVLHNKLDPIQRAAVDIASEVAVHELNASILAQVVQAGQNRLMAEEDLGEMFELADAVERAGEGASPAELDAAAANLEVVLDSASLTTELVSALLGRVAETDQVSRQQVEQVRADLSTVDTLVRDVRAAPAARDAPRKAVEISRLIGDLEQPMRDLLAVPAETIVQPFQHDAESVVGRDVSPVDFFVPSAIALLVQHAGMTFAALAVVRDRNLGFDEIYRVRGAPQSAVLAGKGFGFFVMSMALGGLLLVFVRLVLGFHSTGSVAPVLLGLTMLLVAAIPAGLAISALARSTTQAVQTVMLVLLASIFFGGFFLDLSAIRYPFKALAWLLPVTYGIRALQDATLRGQAAASIDLFGLGAIAVVAGGVAFWAVRRSAHQ